MSHHDEDGPGAYVRRVSQETQRYAEELIAENHQLRMRIGALEGEHHRLQAESDRFAGQYRELEAQNTNLANLYVASYRLHGTVDRDEVLGTIQEIVTNLVGSEELAVFEADEGGLRLVASTGIDPDPFRRVACGAGVIGRCARTGETFVRGDGIAGEALPAEADLSACVPLKLDGRVSGAIALFRLLPQKAALEALDRELFDLLATHAATALYCATLHARSVVPAS